MFDFDSHTGFTRDTSEPPPSSGELSSKKTEEIRHTAPIRKALTNPGWLEKRAFQTKDRDLEIEKKRQLSKQGWIRKANRRAGRSGWLYGTILAREDDPATASSSKSLLRKGSMPPPKEWEPPQRDVEAEKLQALRELGDRVEEVFRSFKDTPNVFYIAVAVSLVRNIYKAFQAGLSPEEIEEILQQKAQPLQKKGDVFLHRPKQEDSLQAPDLSGIPLWEGSKRGEKVKALDYLKTHYGQWLSSFGAAEDSVFQDNIRGHDRTLIQGLKNQLRQEGRGHKVSDFVKTRSARVDRELENVSVAELKKTRRLASTLHSRETRAAKSKAVFPSHSVTGK